MFRRGEKKQEPPSKAPSCFLMMLTDSPAGEVQHRPTVKHRAAWFHFPSDEPLRRSARFGEEADISGQQVNRDLSAGFLFHLLEISTVQGEKSWKREGSGRPGIWFWLGHLFVL